MKIIAYYLPQFHTFPENDEWWGKGFTEWTNVKNARPLFQGHYQPRIPLGMRYYDLLDEKTLEWQNNLAKEYGIYGFCYYHYWFDGKMLMQKPMELMLKDRNIKQKFCICWANEDWTKAWAKKNKTVLLTQTYGDKEDWIRHFEYLFRFFADDRYIKIDGKPLMIIYRPELIPTLREMVLCWQKLAKQKGLPGITLAYQQVYYNHLTNNGGDLFSYGIEYQPGFEKRYQQRTFSIRFHKICNEIVRRTNIKQSKLSSIVYDYDDSWERILNRKPRDEKMIPGAFVNWDNTPRYGNGASIYVGYTPEKFQKYLTLQIQRARDVYKKDFLFMFAWNEWGEGGFLEPDEREKYARLEAVRNALINSKEFVKED